MEARFRQYVSQTPTETGCLFWTGYAYRGRGFFSVNGKPEMAHRVSYRLAKGEIPDGQCIRHTCDTPICVNPDHLLLGTHRDNMTDMKERNRRKGKVATQGSRHGCAKLTDEQAREVLASIETRNQLAQRLGVSPSTIKAIRTGRRWKHLAEEQ